jgi:transcriptional regulator with XRE-family HTH domain
MGTRGVKLDGERLTYLYQARGWSQQDLARKSGLDVRTITKVKTGRACDASTHLCLALALDVPPEELLFERDPPPSLVAHLLDPLDPSRANGAAATARAEELPPAETARPAKKPKSYFKIEQAWKIVDLRSPTESSAASPAKGKGKAKAKSGKTATPASGTICDYYRIRKLDDSQREIVFPYLTWGEGIECLAIPAGATWNKVAVQPGDLVHSEKQWELRLTAPAGEQGTIFECHPIQLRYLDAFHREGQSWWQVRVGYEMESLIIQVMFAAEQPCRSIKGTMALLGEREFSEVPDNAPHLLEDGTLASWHIPFPQFGAFYKLAWSWE